MGLVSLCLELLTQRIQAGTVTGKEHVSERSFGTEDLYTVHMTSDTPLLRRTSHEGVLHLRS